MPWAREIAAVFAPNRAVSAGAMRVIVATQVALALLFWWGSPLPILPRPDEVYRALGVLWFEQGLGRELWTSVLVNLEALAFTLVISLGLSYLTVLPIFRPIAAAASKGRFLGLIGITVFFVTSMLDVVAAIPKESFDHARTLRMSEWRAVWEVVVLGTAEKAMDVLRQNAAIGWMMLTMVEGISRSEGGVGAMLLNQNRHFHLAEVFAIQILILLVGVAQDYGLGVLRRVLFPYADLGLERRGA